MLSLKIRKERLGEFQKIFQGNTVKCRDMLLTIIFGYYRKDKAVTKTEKMGRAKELNKTQDFTVWDQSLIDLISIWMPTQQS